MSPRDLVSEAVAGLHRPPGARRADRARHGDRRRRARRDARPVEDGEQPDRRPLRRARGDRRRRQPSVARRAAPRGAVLPWDAEARLRRLNGVVAAGTLADVDVRGALVRSVPINDPLAASATAAADEGRLARALPGRPGRSCPRDGSPTPATRARADRVVVLGVNAARRSASRGVDQQPAIFIGDRLYVVIGAPGRRPPPAVAARRGRSCPRAPRGASSASRRPRSRRSRPGIGAVDLIVRQAPMALSPTNPTLAQGRRAARPARAARRGEERPQRAVPAARRRVAAGRRDRHRERDARLGARARRRDRAAPRARRRRAGTSPAQFLLESTAMGLRRRHHRRERRHARGRRRVGGQHLDARARSVGAARRAARSARSSGCCPAPIPRCAPRPWSPSRRCAPARERPRHGGTIVRPDPLPRPAPPCRGARRRRARAPGRGAAHRGVRRRLRRRRHRGGDTRGGDVRVGRAERRERRGPARASTRPASWPARAGSRPRSRSA